MNRPLFSPQKFLLLLVLSSAALPILPGKGRADQNPLSQSSSYTVLLRSAFSYYREGNTDTALSYYRRAAATASSADEYLEARIGEQNCLVSLRRYSESLSLGKSLLEKFPENSAVLFNNAFSLFSLKNYSEAAEFYEKIRSISPESLPALQGLAWCRYYLGERRQARRLVAEGLERDPRNASLLQLSSLLLTSPWSFSLTGYTTYLDYHSITKDQGWTGTFFLTATHKKRHSFEAIVSRLALDYLSPTEPPLKETSYGAGYRFFGPVAFALLLRRFNTNDPTLGKANIATVSLEKANFFLRTTLSDYAFVDAVQIGIGYRFHRGRYSLVSELSHVSHDAIGLLAPPDDHWFLAQRHSLTFGRWTPYLKYLLGHGSIYTGEEGYVPYNTPDELRGIYGLGLHWSGDFLTLGWETTYSRGRHFTTSDHRPYDLFTHTLSVGHRW